LIRNSPRPGDIGLVRIKGWVGWLIRILQWFNGDGFSQYEHAFIVLEDGMLIEAMPGGAQIVSLDEYAGEDVLYVSPAGLTDADRQRICAEARKYEDVPYSFVDYAAIAAHRLHLPYPGLRVFVESSAHMICSQLVDQSYRDAGIKLFSDERWAGYVTPGSLNKRLG
jgi:cell wall-associated NlpC family hydrolase